MMLKITENDISMTKHIFPHIIFPCTFIGLTLISTSCSQDDVNGVRNYVEGSRIEFHASLPEITSRATEVTDTTLYDIQVSAFTVGESDETTYFLNKTFGRNSNTGKFVCYDPECIWPNNNDLLRFTAFAPSCEVMVEAGGAATSTGDKITSFKVAEDIAKQFDFVTATATGRLLDNEDSGIALKFQHQMSRIKLNAWGNSASYDLEIAGVRLGGVATEGVFNFTSQAEAAGPAQAGIWESISKGSVEYIFRKGDAILTLDKTDGSPVSADKAVSILGSKVGGEGGYENSAMIIPSDNAAWSCKDNAANGDSHADGMYFSVLLRVKDTTPYDTNGSIIYPYKGAEYSDEIVYLAVDKTDGKTVRTRLYKQGEDYFSEVGHTEAYDSDTEGTEIKAFGWAALPIADDLKPGRIYTYTLNYSSGVGLRDPRDSHPGDPIISDRVLVNVEVAEWADGAKTDVTVPRR